MAPEFLLYPTEIARKVETPGMLFARMDYHRNHYHFWRGLAMENLLLQCKSPADSIHII
jgi:hypothetical protein